MPKRSTSRSTLTRDQSKKKCSKTEQAVNRKEISRSQEGTKLRRCSARIASLDPAAPKSSSTMRANSRSLQEDKIAQPLPVIDETSNVVPNEKSTCKIRSKRSRTSSNNFDNTSKQENPRRSKRIKGKDRNSSEGVISAITPSPAVARANASGVNVANGMHIHMDIAQEARNDWTSDLYPLYPPGVNSILCPFMVNHRQAFLTKQSAPCGSKQPCGCFFQFNDSSAVLNIESYLSAYSNEYIESLFEKELNIQHIPNDFYPKRLQSCPTKQKPKRRSPRLSHIDSERESSSKFFGTDKSPASVTSTPAVSIRSTSTRRNSFFSAKKSSSTNVDSECRALSEQRYEYYMDYASRQENITHFMRAVLIDWLIEVAEEYTISAVSLHTAVGLVDRCLACCEIAKDSALEEPSRTLISSSNARSRARSKSSSSDCVDFSAGGKLVVDRKTLQLLGCGCMMIACKMHETTPPDVIDFCYISASTYSKQQVIEMEYKISSLLAFNFHIITPHHFVNIFLRAHYVSGHGAGTKPACSLSYEDNMKHLVDYLLEIASLTYSFVKEPPSKVAAAAIYLARATLGIRDASTLDAEEGTQGFFSRTLQYYSGYEESDLKPLVIKLRFAHKNSESANLHSVYDKYSKKAFKMVAHLVPVAMEVLF